MKTNTFLFLFFALIGIISVLFLFSNKKIPIQPLAVVKNGYFSIENPPAQSLKGTITSFAGHVTWLSRTAVTPIPITSPHPLQQGEEVSTESNSTAQFSFQNNFTATLSANTHINIIQTLPANIVVAQINGLVDYQKENSPTPLSVRAFDLLINIKEGKITVTTDKKKSVVNVVVHDGACMVAYTSVQNTSVVTTITKGKEFIYDNDTKRGILR